MVLLSVIIVSYNNMDEVQDCLESISLHNDLGEELEVIVVDNSETNDGFLELKNKFEKVKFIKNKNRGFGHGNNKGFNISKGEYLLFLNPDTKIISPLFNFAVNKFNENPKLGLFGVKMLDENRKKNLSFYFMDDSGFLASIATKILNQFDIFINRTMFTSGANMFIRRKAFIEAGRFDEQIFLYNEESDLTKRMLKLGYKNEYFPEKKIIHLEGIRNIESKFSLSERLKSFEYYCQKHNLKFQKKMKYEIRYDEFKLLYYNFVKKDKCMHQVRENLIIKKEYLDNFLENL